MWRAVAVFSALAGITSCSSTHSSIPAVPAIAEADSGWLCGVVTYDGTNPDYIPRVIQVADDRTDVRISYRYQVSYDVERETAWDLYNPFVVLGWPKSKDDVGASARLEIGVSGSDYSRVFDESVVLSKKKFLFSEGDTLTDMRRAALLQLRDAIDRAVIADRQELEANLKCEGE